MFFFMECVFQFLAFTRRMLAVGGRSCSRGLIVWFFLTNLLLVLYYITHSAHVAMR